jgi:asparagine synthase (glutamine-hydrolysing)
VQPWLPNGLRHVLSSLPLPGGAGQWFRLWAQHGWRDMCASKPLHMTHHWTEEEKGGLWLDAKGLGSTEARMRGWHDGTEHPIDRIQQVYSQDWLTEDLLMKADKMSMATSLEVREPFLDRALAEWAARLPLVWRVGSSRTGWRSKRILREFCARRLPASILARPKQGFPVPAYGWLGGRLKKWAETLLFSADSRLSGYFDLSRAKPVFLQACGGNGAAAHKVWILIVLEHWLREWQ